MEALQFLIDGITHVTWEQVIMWGVGAVLIYLAIAKKIEPALLLPMGFGAILINIPFSGAMGEAGIIQWLFELGIEASEAMPLLLFIGIGAMIDVGPLLSNPKLIFFGAAAQVGIFITIGLAAACGFNIADASAIGIIGAADGPTSILVANVLKSSYIGPIAVVAYSYMALVPIIQPAVIKAVTTKKERMIRMDYSPAKVKKSTKILFPIIVTVISGLVAPDSVSLVGMLMFGNLLRECGVLESLSDTAKTVLTNLITLLLGITIAASMKAENFVTLQTLIIMCLGLFAFCFDTVGGVLFAKFVNLFLPKGKKINPMVGAAGISAFPMASRVVQKMGIQADPSNHLLMHAVSANVSGQIASVVAGGVILSIVPAIIAGL